MILENAVKAPLEKDAQYSCSHFRMTNSQVRRYFSNAKRVEQNEAHHALDWSPCGARGSVIFRDGKTAEWAISEFRVGTITLPDGKELAVYCPTCKFKPFSW